MVRLCEITFNDLNNKPVAYIKRHNSSLKAVRIRFDDEIDKIQDNEYIVPTKVYDKDGKFLRNSTKKKSTKGVIKLLVKSINALETFDMELIRRLVEETVDLKCGRDYQIFEINEN